MTLTKGQHAFDFAFDFDGALPPSVSGGSDCYVRYVMAAVLNTPGLSFKCTKKVALHCDGTYDPSHFDVRGNALLLCK